MKYLIRPRRNKADSAECNYIVWTSVNGLGNRMASMASAFLYTLVTDRVLMVDFEDEMKGLFCEPFSNSSWILPKVFPFINRPGHIETYQNMTKKDREKKKKRFKTYFCIGSTSKFAAYQ
ncbi:hypothetical protein K1719_033513 [Acacia pycnantha]|nr:hypothetical protein K1719_033513 [Acacia pycnantha]